MPEPRSDALARTPLSAWHESLGATMTDFAGLADAAALPQRNRRAQRGQDGGPPLFDLSHMGELRVTGAEASAALDYALVSDISAIRPGRAKYTMIVAEDGGVIDDLIVYGWRPGLPGGRQRVERRHGGRRADYTGGRPGRAGERPHQRLCADRHPGPEVGGHLVRADRRRPRRKRYYAGYPSEVAGLPVLLARTGYTGEDGFEIFTRPQDAPHLWSALTEGRRSRRPDPGRARGQDSLRSRPGCRCTATNSTGS